MPIIPDFKFTLSSANMPDLPSLQAEVRRWNFLLPIALLEVRRVANGLCRAEVAGVQTTFSCEQRTVEDIVGRDHSELRNDFAFGFAFGGQGDLVSSVTAGVAALCYATASRGVFYVSGFGPFLDTPALRKGIDGTLAAHFDRLDIFHDRYPEEGQSGGHIGPAYVSSRLAT